MRSRAVLLALALPLLACAPDAPGTSSPPPADDGATPSTDTPAASPDAAEPVGELLGHVKVGQRYHFHMNQSGSEMDMVWTVTEVTEKVVKYDVSVLKNGVAVSPPSGTSWTVPPPVMKAPKTSVKSKTKLSREQITLAEQPWTCRVTTTGDVKTWVPVHGERVTFPPLLKQTKGEVISTVLTKIESP